MRGLFMRHSPRRTWGERYAVSRARAPGVRIRLEARALRARERGTITSVGPSRGCLLRMGISLLVIVIVWLLVLLELRKAIGS
jgi:hypothetical protein